MIYGIYNKGVQWGRGIYNTYTNVGKKSQEKSHGKKSQEKSHK